MKKDCHVHTTLSHDGVSDIEEYVYHAVEMGVDEITFTEHYDIYDDIDSNLKPVDVDEYFKRYKTLISRSNIVLNFGIEIGLQPDKGKEIKNLVNSYPFDYVIGSSHITCKKDMSKDPSYFEGLTRHEAYMNYFNEVYQNIILFKDDFDVYGHLDYVVRYGGYEEKEINYEEFSDILDKILIALIKNGKGLEINTSGYRYNLPNMHPNKDILKRYKELGGKIVTIGSDAHNVKDLGKDFEDAYRILKECGFEEYTVYHQRKPSFIEVPTLDKRRELC